MAIYNASVIVCSDTCSENPNLDESGIYVKKRIVGTALFSNVSLQIIEDDEGAIRNLVYSTTQQDSNVLTITVGGTGLCPRDVTPEATSRLYDKPCHGIVAALYHACLRYTPHAALSRLTAGISGSCLIINFPGKRKACQDCFDCIEPILAHALEQVKFNGPAVKATHLLQDKIADNIILTDHEGQGSKDVGSIQRSRQISDQEREKRIIEKAQQIFRSNQKPLKSSKAAKLLSPMGDIPNTAAKVDRRPIEKSKTVNNSPDPSKLLSLLSIKSSFPLIEYEDALKIVHEQSQYLHRAKITFTLKSLQTIQSAIGSTLAQDVRSRIRVPPVSVSTMDGFVLNIPHAYRKVMSSMRNIPAQLVSSTEEFLALQRDPISSKRFFCCRVNTGNRVPEDEDSFAVIPVELTTEAGGIISIIGDVKQGQFIRRPGSDLDGTDCLEKGTKIGPVELGLIIAMGHREISIFKRPRVGLLSTGDELVSFDDCTTSDKSVFDINSPILFNLFRSRRFQTYFKGICPDNESQLAYTIKKSLEDCDVLVITGGASMGTCDYVKKVIQKLNGKILFGRVNMKPGKPVAFAKITRGSEVKFIFSLPGNPVSAYITSLVLVLPFLSHCHSQNTSVSSHGQVIDVVIASIRDGDTYKFDGRLEFLRAKIILEACTGSQYIHSVEVSVKQQSSRVMSLKSCDCLVMIPASQSGSLCEGQTYKAIKI